MERSVRQRSWRRVAAAVVFVLLVAVALLAAALVHAGSALVVSRDVRQPDAILVLASHEWERLPAAARLARIYPRAAVLLTQPTVPTQSNCYDCAERVSWLDYLGVDERRVRVIKPTGENTLDEATTALLFCRTQSINSLLVVTSPYHARRALWVFDRTFAGSGVQVGLHPVMEESRADPSHWWRRDYDRDYVAYEWAALAYYALQFALHG